AQEGGWSIGWRWHPSQSFDHQRLAQWLTRWDWRRAKLVIHSTDGWISGNAVDNSPLVWQPSEWRRDSRIELIFSAPQDVAALQQALAACRH
ncbi:GTP-binding protein, partial [Salmonella enterica]